MANAPTSDDQTEVVRRFIVGLTHGHDPHQLVADVGDLHVAHNTFPGEVFMELSADVLEITAVDRTHPIDLGSLLTTHLPEVSFRGKENRRIQYAILTAFAANGGLKPDLLEEVSYWIESYWSYALYAAVAITRAAGATKDSSVEEVLIQLAAKHKIDLQ